VDTRTFNCTQVMMCGDSCRLVVDDDDDDDAYQPAPVVEEKKSSRRRRRRIRNVCGRRYRSVAAAALAC
jgi:hypothetical protein